MAKPPASSGQNASADASFLEAVQTSKAYPDDTLSPSATATFGHTASELALYETPLVTVDIVVFTIRDNSLRVLLIERKDAPYQHMWAIPGGFIHTGETLEDAAGRRLQEETNVENIYLEQLYAFGQPQRDPRSRVITVAYFALIGSNTLKLKADANAADVRWFSVAELPELAFDHADIVAVALKRLKERLETSPVAFQLLPEKFTLSELQRAYELIWGKTLDKRNFRKKILSSGILRDTGETKMEGYHRPAQLYAFLAV